MSERKPTPDVLAGLLGGFGSETGETAVDDFVGNPARKPAKPAPTSRARSKPPAEKKAPSRSSDPISKGVLQHRVASFQEHRGWRLRFIDGAEVKNWTSGMTVAEYIAEMAEEGWEIAGACSGQALFGVLDKYQVFFKRRQ